MDFIQEDQVKFGKQESQQ